MVMVENSWQKPDPPPPTQIPTLPASFYSPPTWREAVQQNESESQVAIKMKKLRVEHEQDVTALHQ